MLAWLDEKKERSGSAATLSAYESTFKAFVAVLAQLGLAYDDAAAAGAIATAIQGWAGQSKKGKVAPATYNQRVAIVSSFYEYARRHGMITMDNPAARVSRRRGESTGYAEPRSASSLRACLAEIDRTTLIGKRDYAILIVGLATGRRVGELASLARCDVRFSEETTTIHFRVMKGGKERRDKIPARIAFALSEYMEAAEAALRDAKLPCDDSTPVWLGLSNRDRFGAAGRRAIAGVCDRWLHTRQTHTLRHSFALMMQEAGATVFEIQACLGHAHATTTDLYLRRRVQSPANPHGENLADRLGL